MRPHPTPTKYASPPPGAARVGGLPLALLLLATPARAEVSDVTVMLDAAMAEQRVFFTCSSFTPDTNAYLRNTWASSVSETVKLLGKANATPPNLAAFIASALPGSLLPAPGTPFSDVLAFCTANSDWDARYARLNFIIPQLVVEETLAK